MLKGDEMNTFQRQLAFGQIAETEIAKWLLARGAVVLPVYDIEYETGKGPRLFTGSGQLIAPDLLVWKKQICWIEAKHKSVFTWHRKTMRWTTGIDKRHWHQYLKVRSLVDISIWLLFLHRSESPDRRDLQWDCPPRCPSGLFGGSLDRLENCINHDVPAGNGGWGASGMVYWAHESLKKLATVEEVIGESEIPLDREAKRN